LAAAHYQRRRAARLNEQQRRDIAAGTAKLYGHEEVMAGARAILDKARDAKA
jgi:hypothetical protein